MEERLVRHQHALQPEIVQLGRAHAERVPGAHDLEARRVDRDAVEEQHVRAERRVLETRAGRKCVATSDSVPCFSTAYDNRSVAPRYVVSSTYNNWRPWLTQVITAAAAGKLKTFTYYGTFGNGGLAATPFNGPSAKLVPANVRTQFKAMLKQLGTKAIKLPASTSHPGYR